jgi:hypothetical protein
MATRGPRYPKEEFARRGDEIYNRGIRPLVENEENKGKFVLIDIETGAWEMDADEIAVTRKLEARLPDPQAWMVRVGYPYVHKIGGGKSWRVA